jgi:hypothetical protein
MTGTSEIPSGTGEAAAQRPDRGTPPRQPEKPQARPYSIAAFLALLAWLVILAAAGAGARALHAPPPYAAAAAWLALAAALAWLSRRRFWTGRGHPGRHYRAADPWRPGDPFPEGIPAATMEAAGRILARDPGGRRAQLRIAACEDPARHQGICQAAARQEPRS